VDKVFGYPGGAILPAYDALRKFPIHHILVRHEQGAAHMADGYARASGKVGVCIATSGPGATNLVTGIATAMLDSIPIVAITGQVGSKVLGSDAFQEIDITWASPCPSPMHNYLVTRAEDIAPAIREALQIAKSGRPGPVLVDITKDAQQATAPFNFEAAAPAPYRPAPHAARRILSDSRGYCPHQGCKEAHHPRRPRHHALRRRSPGPRLRRTPADSRRQHAPRPRRSPPRIIHCH